MLSIVRFRDFWNAPGFCFADSFSRAGWPRQVDPRQLARAPNSSWGLGTANPTAQHILIWSCTIPVSHGERGRAPRSYLSPCSRDPPSAGRRDFPLRQVELWVVLYRAQRLARDLVIHLGQVLEVHREMNPTSRPAEMKRNRLLGRNSLFRAPGIAQERLRDDSVLYDRYGWPVSFCLFSRRLSACSAPAASRRRGGLWTGLSRSPVWGNVLHACPLAHGASLLAQILLPARWATILHGHLRARSMVFLSGMWTPAH